MALRHALTNAQWAQIEPLLPKFKGGRPSTMGHRLFIDAVLWRAKTGCAWRDLHSRFGPWKTVYNRFRDWSQFEIWPQMANELMDPRQKANSILDSTIVRAHQDSCGGTGGVKKRDPQVGRGARQRSMLWSIIEENLKKFSFLAEIDATASSRMYFRRDVVKVQ